MKRFLDIVLSWGLWVFATIIFLLNLLAFKYVEGFSSYWLLVVIEFTAIVSYIISRLIGDADKRVF